MSEPAPQESGRYTYGEYCRWPDEERWELIDGVPYDMSPAPSRTHQEILGELHLQIAPFLRDKGCAVYLAPFDVRLPDNDAQPDSEVPTVVQPDITVICDDGKLDEAGCRGAPDWVIEILSPSTAPKDLREKLLLYERHGVREYWVVHPRENVIEVFRRSDAGAYGRPEAYGPEARIPVSVLHGLEIEAETVFRR